MLKSVLIANRGEIACRVIETARRMGLRTIAVYSEADHGARHCRLADEAVAIGPAAPAESYLVPDRIIEAARQAGADCIHPGYGFLSENADFAERCAAAGIVFVGPSADAIRAMGLKDGAKKLMQDAGVPVVPGYHGDRQDAEFLRRKAYEIGYPVLIKAVAGGGGKGMRLVEKAIEFDPALESAVREAQNAFGNSHVLIEKYIASPRHVEVQIFGDQHGNVIHLYERDCSLQRRHQKVIEEAPAPDIDARTRTAMGAAAVAAAKAVDYCGAGTVEFIADGSEGLRPDGFWFMEMNTRLQVEHPVTEAVTGEDLVEWQFLVASGEPLPKSQDQLRLSGHAVEARLYAEDPAGGFLPSTGKLWTLSLPQTEEVRVDTGVEEGDVVSAAYDPMIAKVIAHAETRDGALDKLSAALSATVVAGPKTNAGFLRALADHAEFRQGRFDTGFIDRHLDDLVGRPVTEPAAVAAGARRLIERHGHGRSAAGLSVAGAPQSPWDTSDGFTNGPPRTRGFPLRVDGEDRLATASWPDGQLAVAVDGATSGAAENTAMRIVETDHSVLLVVDGAQTEIELVDSLAADAEGEGGHGTVRAPMSGKVIAVHVSVGDTVRRGAPLFAVEAMKMEHAVTATVDGVVEEVLVSAGEQVGERDRIVVIAEAQSD